MSIKRPQRGSKGLLEQNKKIQPTTEKPNSVPGKAKPTAKKREPEATFTHKLGIPCRREEVCRMQPKARGSLVVQLRTPGSGELLRT